MARRSAGVLYATAAVVFSADRVTKVLVEHTLRGRPSVEVIPGVLQLTYTTNPGGAFGLFGGASWLFVLATVLVCAAIIVASFRLQANPMAVALGLILGGALGNVTDRIFRGPGFTGHVVDFIDFRVWPVFNVADSAIVIGALLIVLSGFRRTERAEDA